MINRELDTACHYVDALIHGDGDTAMRCLSEDFGMHHGKRMEAHIAHELSEFARRMPINRLMEGFSLLIRDDCGSHSPNLQVFDRNGRFVYEDRITFDDCGLIVGNQSELEIVTKLRIDRGHVSRAMAIRAHDGPVEKVLPHGCVSNLVTAQPSHDDGFSYCTFDLDGDRHESLSMDVWFQVEGRPGVIRERVLFRGKDRPAFIDDLYPRVINETVFVDTSRSNVWALSVWFEDGRHMQFEDVGDGLFRFDKKVVQAVVTDALDNDWVTRVNG